MAATEVCFMQDNNRKNLTKNGITENGIKYFTQILSTNNKYTNNGKGILDFYKDTSLFLTGITGFVGKTLLEKLLRSCEGIKTIYVLVRPKKGQHGIERISAIVDSPAFDEIKKTNPQLFSKLVVIGGDCSQEHLGISEEDRQTLIENVNIVFHSAASVRFNEPLQDAINLNTNGTKRMLELCKNMKHLKSFVYVSTAFSNSDKMNEEIREEVYKPRFDSEGLIVTTKILPPELIGNIESKIIDGHPNTYTFSKALAEDIVLRYSSVIPAVIVRPSIVTASIKEPLPGWTDSMTGITGIMSEVGRGSISSAICNRDNRVDLIPVDILNNTLITAPWFDYHNKTNSLRVINCTTGRWKPVTWRVYSELVERFAKEYPSKYVTWYPYIRLTMNKTVFWFLQMFLQYILVIVIDSHNSLTSKNNKKQIILTKYYKKIMTLLDHLVFFTVTEFDFAQDNMKMLAREVCKTSDGKKFDLDLSGLNLEKYVENYTLGIRKFLLKDDLSSLPQAKTSLSRLYWIKILLEAFAAYILITGLCWLIGIKIWPIL